MADFQQDLDHELNQWYKAFEDMANALIKGGTNVLKKVIDHYKNERDGQENDQDRIELKKMLDKAGVSIGDVYNVLNSIAHHFSAEDFSKVLNSFMDKFQETEQEIDFGENENVKDEEIDWSDFDQEVDERTQDNQKQGHDHKEKGDFDFGPEQDNKDKDLGDFDFEKENVFDR